MEQYRKLYWTLVKNFIMIPLTKSTISSVDADESAISVSSPRSMSSSIFSSSFVVSGFEGGTHFFPLTVPGTYGTASGMSGVLSACSLMKSKSFFLSRGPVGSFSHLYVHRMDGGMLGTKIAHVKFHKMNSNHFPKNLLTSDHPDRIRRVAFVSLPALVVPPARQCPTR